MAAPQFLHGSTRPIEATFDTTDTTITFSPGNLLTISGANVSNLGTSTVTTSFIGVSAQKKTAGITGLGKRLFGNSTDGILRVDTDGEWEYDRSDTVAINVGDPVGPDGTTANTLKKVGNASIGVGVCVKNILDTTTDPSATRVRVKIQSVKSAAALNT